MIAQIAFLRALVERLQCPPLWNKLVNRRGTYFQRLDPKRAPVLGMPKLLRRCCFFLGIAKPWITASVYTYIYEAFTRPYN